MRNRGMREWSRGVVISLVAFLCATLTVILPIASYATQQSYESYYCEVFYDDAGDSNDDNLAYWLTYTTADPISDTNCASIDWAFMYAMWGLGWDKIFLASGGIQDIISSVGKLPVYLVDEGENGTYGYTYFEWGGYTSWGIYLNYAYYPDIMATTGFDDVVNEITGTAGPDGRPDSTTDGYYSSWWNPLFNICSVAAHETSHAIYGKYVGYKWFNGELSNLYYYHGFLTETLAWYVGSVMWPISDFHEDLDSIKSQYKASMEADDYIYTSWGKAEYNYRFATTYDEFNRGTMTFLGAGYMFSNWDDLFGSITSPNYVAAWSGALAGSVYRVFNLITYLRYDAGNDDFSGAFANAYDGHPVRMSSLTYWNLDPDSNDLNAWLFFLMWDYWYQT